MQEGFPQQATGVSAKRAAGLRVACRISSGDAARTAIAVALAIGIPEGSQRRVTQSLSEINSLRTCEILYLVGKGLR
ncbi:hypothetical protein NIES4073_64630 [Kalymmatonema gypsitolerans NIES-4073]|nr:hypothetical protein NIES4073_64630 [Scytonema sp. NIES-4073]